MEREKGRLEETRFQTSEERRKEEGRGKRKSLDNGRSMSVPADPPRTRCPASLPIRLAGSLMGAEGEGEGGRLERGMRE